MTQRGNWCIFIGNELADNLRYNTFATKVIDIRHTDFSRVSVLFAIKTM